MPLAGQIERIRRFYEPILAKVYENPEPRRRDLEQLEQIAGGYRSRRKVPDRPDARPSDQHRRFRRPAHPG